MIKGSIRDSSLGGMKGCEMFLSVEWFPSTISCKGVGQFTNRTVPPLPLPPPPLPISGGGGLWELGIQKLGIVSSVPTT